jgi:hypothetical protein
LVEWKALLPLFPSTLVLWVLNHKAHRESRFHIIMAPGDVKCCRWSQIPRSQGCSNSPGLEAIDVGISDSIVSLAFSFT